MKNSAKIYKLRGAKIRKISCYNITIKKNWNNYFVTAFSRFQGTVFEKISGAYSSLKGSKRSTTTALERISNIFIKDLLTHKVLRKKFDFSIQTPYLSKGVKNSLKLMLSARRRVFLKGVRKVKQKSLRVRNIILDFKVSHNGCKGA